MQRLRPINPFLRPVCLFVLAFLFLWACGGHEDKTDRKGEKEGADKAEKVVQKAMDHYGVDALDHGRVAFDFRDKHYIYRRKGDRFQYERRFSDTAGDSIRDVYTNDGFRRFVNDSLVSLSAKDSLAYLHSVNSVFYFAFLPYKLDDPAVIPTYKGTVRIGGRDYHQVHIAFRKEGGGKDHEDEFLYWFRKGNGSMDYFSYRYHTEGGGVRFRKAFNKRKVGGIRFQDHYNFKAPKDVALEKLPRAFMEGRIDTVSRIVLEHIEVRDDPGFRPF